VKYGAIHVFETAKVPCPQEISACNMIIILKYVNIDEIKKNNVDFNK
jgi:hypothetical protein